ncbi:hypothetical protein ABFS83_14G249200 [Erythranthe nasuta]
MRVFTAARKKNCYHIDTMRRGRVLVRATFYYGNYDNKSSPPTFDLHFDGNFWKTVVTSISEVVSYEVIYVMRSDWITVCLARTKDGQFPFISTLEIRNLDWFMYTGIAESYPLFLRRRDPFDSGIIRYPNDPYYDRMWSTEIAISGQNRFYSDAYIYIILLIHFVPMYMYLHI